MACRILVCDDNDDDVYILLHTFKAAGIAVECARARDGEEALTSLTTGEVYDLVILDNHLPRRSGSEVMEIIYNRGQNPPCPVVMLSSQVVNGKESPGKHGVHAIIEKPFTLDGYMTVVESLATLCPVAAR